MVFFNRKGLSNVIVVVLLVLLVLVAAIFIWIYVSSSVTKASQNIVLQEKCYATDVDLLDCEYGSLGSTHFVTGLVRLQDGDTSDIKVTFVTNDGRSFVHELEPINVLQTKKLLPPIQLPNPPEYAVASPIVYSEDGSESLTCTLSKKVFCNDAGLSGNLCELPTFIEDVGPFVLAILSDKASYAAEYPDCSYLNADFDCDGSSDTHDIDSFRAVIQNAWVNCNRDIICSEVNQNPSWGGSAWYQNTDAVAFFNSTCR